MSKQTLVIISPFRTRSGYGQHSRLILDAIFNTPEITDNYDIKLISTKWGSTPLTGIDLDNPMHQLWLQHEVIQLAEQPDVSIQISIPSEFQRIGKKSFGITAGSEVTIAPLKFVEGCNIVDLVIVPSQFTKDVLLGTKYDKKDPNGRIEHTLQVDKPFEVLFEGLDLEIFNKNNYVKDSPIVQQLNEIKEPFAYLCCGMWTQGELGQDRKDVGSVVKVFYDSFKNKKNRPALVLKVNGAGFSFPERDQIIEKINDIQEIVRSEGFEGKLPNVYLINGDLSDSEMNTLYNHPKIKALVNFAKAEGFCTKPETKIVTKTGLKHIIDINEGEYVLTHTGRYKPVLKTIQHEYDGEMINIKVTGASDVVSLTPNHEVFVYNRKLNSFGWKPAGHLKITDYLCFPKLTETKYIKYIKINEYLKPTSNIFEAQGQLYYKHSNKMGKMINNELILSSHLGKIIGYYLSEGTVSNGQIIYSIHKKEIDTIGKELIDAFSSVFGIDYVNIVPHKTKNSARVIFSNQIVCELLVGMCGHLARKKRLPEIIYSAPDEFKESLLTSMLVGDGSIKTDGVRIQLVNELLISDFKLLTMLMGMPSSYNMRVLNNGNFAPRIGWFTTDIYNSLIKIIQKNHDFITNDHKQLTRLHYISKFISTEEYSTFKIKSINVDTFTGTVYNLSVADDETYCTEFFAVHNCLPLLEFTSTGKPIICSGYSGQMDFLNPDFTCLLPGQLTQIHRSASNEWLPKEGQWFTANYAYAGQVMIDVFENYDKHLERSRKMVKYTKDNFSLEAMRLKFLDIWNRYVTPEPKRIQLNLPQLKKIT